MASPIAELQQRAVEFARRADFGPQALEINLELTRIAPDNEGAWTRLARCYLESGQLDEASAALDAVVRLNPQNTIAHNLQGEVAKRRAGATFAGVPSTTRRRRSPRPGTRMAAGGARSPSEPAAPGGGFGRAEFAALSHLAPRAAVDALAPRIESLLMALNERPFAGKAVETRNRAGHGGVRLYRRNSFYPGNRGHIFAFHHGGRWEPQLNIGFYSAAAWGSDCVRAGIGFNLTQDAADPDRVAGQEQVIRQFEHFQQLVAGEWRPLLTAWMGANGGLIQYDGHAPAADLLPQDAVAWLASCRNPVEIGWVFCGRWLFANRSEQFDILSDGRRLASWIEQCFVDLLPLWSTLYRR